MFVATGTTATLYRHAKLMIVAALLMLSLLGSAVVSTQHVSAEKPKPAQATSQGDARAKLQTTCVQFNVEEWKFLTGEDTDAGGIMCFKV